MRMNDNKFKPTQGKQCLLSTNVTNLQTQSSCAPTINQPCLAPKANMERKKEKDKALKM